MEKETKFNFLDNSHMVVKNSDILNYLDDHQITHFRSLLNQIAQGRKMDGKTPANSYWVVNKDEPYAMEIIDVIRKGELKKLEK